MSSRSGRFLRPRISRYKNRGASRTIFVWGYIEEQYFDGLTEKEQHHVMDACFAYERRHSRDSRLSGRPSRRPRRSWEVWVEARKCTPPLPCTPIGLTLACPPPFG